jgi:hypothetical protein
MKPGLHIHLSILFIIFLSFVGPQESVKSTHIPSLVNCNGGKHIHLPKGS